MSDLYPIKRALISVSDKTDVIKLAEALFKRGVEIISTGGSAAAIREVDIPVKDVSELTWLLFGVIYVRFQCCLYILSKGHMEDVVHIVVV